MHIQHTKYNVSLAFGFDLSKADSSKYADPNTQQHDSDNKHLIVIVISSSVGVLVLVLVSALIVFKKLKYVYTV